MKLSILQGVGVIFVESVEDSNLIKSFVKDVKIS